MRKKFRGLLAALAALCLMLSMTAFAEAITVQDAQDAALADAGLEADDVAILSIQAETEHGKSVYDVEFTFGNYEYEYWIDAADGSIVRRSYEPTGAYALELKAAQDEADSTDTVNRNTARLAAIEDAGVGEGDVTYGIVKLDEDDGLQIYEVPFYTDDTEWEYDVDVFTGEIVAMRVEYFTDDETVRPGDQIVTESDEDEEDGTLDSASAKAIALEDAGLTEDEVTIVKLKEDYDDGIIVYEIEFVTDSAEYDYEINASTGEIYECKVKALDGSSLLSAEGAITVDDAKSIAAVHAGFTLDSVTFTKAELETDDGVTEYEIEFTAGGLEYEYKILASDGTILEYEIDD